MKFQFFFLSLKLYEFLTTKLIALFVFKKSKVRSFEIYYMNDILKMKQLHPFSF